MFYQNDAFVAVLRFVGSPNYMCFVLHYLLAPPHCKSGLDNFVGFNLCQTEFCNCIFIFI